MELSVSDIKAIVLNPFLKNSLWDDRQMKAAECMQDRIVVAIDSALEDKNYRQTLEQIKKSRIARAEKG